MKTYTYSGETPAEALKKASEEFGDEAMIIQTKEVRKKTLNQPALYELIIGVPDDVLPKSQNMQGKSAPNPLDSSATNATNTPESSQASQSTNPLENLPNNSIQRRLEAIAEKELAERKKQRTLHAAFDDDVTIQLSDTVREISKIAGFPTSMPDLSALSKPAPTPNNALDSSILESIANAQLNANPSAPRAPKPYSQSEVIDMLPQVSIKSAPNQANTTQSAKTASTKKAKNLAESDDDTSAPNAKAQNTKNEAAAPKGFAPLDDSQSLKDIQDELKKLNDKIKLIQNTLWEEKSPKNMGVEIPKEFAEIYRIAKASGMNKNHLEEIMRLSLELMPLKMRSQSQTIKRYFREVLRKMIYCRKENSIGKKIMMLVGPTGVGKTTTLAKLAARYSQILPQKKKVGIITLDDYRIGAMEQLAWYARKIRLSIDSVSETDDFIDKIEALNYCDYILIDTAGHSQHDKEKINALKKFVKSGDFKVDVTLVLSASTKYEDLKDTYNAFGELDIDTFIFSKLDEARGLGNVFSLVYETKKPISYLSVGQEVPNDVIVADNNYLTDCLMGGFFYPNEK